MHSLKAVNRWLAVTTLFVGLLIALLAGRLVAQPVPVLSDADAREIEMDRHWLNYLLSKHGCQLDGKFSGNVLVAPVTTADCTKGASLVRTDEFAKARELAKRVYGLEEPRRSKQ